MVHDPALLPLNFPTPHVVQPLAPAGLYEPGPHAEQLPAPEPLYNPALHVVQPLDPAALNEPGPHVLHPKLYPPPEYWPAEHVAHFPKVPLPIWSPNIQEIATQ